MSILGFLGGLSLFALPPVFNLPTLGIKCTPRINHQISYYGQIKGFFNRFLTLRLVIVTVTKTDNAIDKFS